MPGCIALSLRGLWPGAAGKGVQGGGGAPAESAPGSEAAPLLAAAEAGSSSSARGAAALRCGGSERWRRAARAADVALAGLLIVVGCLLVANGVLQPLLGY